MIDQTKAQKMLDESKRKIEDLFKTKNTLFEQRKKIDNSLNQIELKIYEEKGRFEALSSIVPQEAVEELVSKPVVKESAPQQEQGVKNSEHLVRTTGARRTQSEVSERSRDDSGKKSYTQEQVDEIVKQARKEGFLQSGKSIPKKAAQSVSPEEFRKSLEEETFDDAPDMPDDNGELLEVRQPKRTASLRGGTVEIVDSGSTKGDDE